MADERRSFTELHEGCPEIECLLWRGLVYQAYITRGDRGESEANLAAEFDLTKHELRAVIRCVQMWLKRESLMPDSVRDLQRLWIARWRKNAKPMVM